MFLSLEFVAHKRKKRNWKENDYYDSDEDTFLDRTGASMQLHFNYCINVLSNSTLYLWWSIDVGFSVKFV